MQWAPECNCGHRQTDHYGIARSRVGPCKHRACTCRAFTPVIPGFVQ